MLQFSHFSPWASSQIPPLLPTLLLSPSLPLSLVSWFLLISQSLFDLRWGDMTLPSSPHAELTIFSCSPLCWAFTVHTPLKVIYSRLSSRCSYLHSKGGRTSAWNQKWTSTRHTTFFIMTWSSNAQKRLINGAAWHVEEGALKLNSFVAEVTSILTETGVWYWRRGL